MLEFIIAAPVVFGLFSYLLSSRPRWAEVSAFLGAAIALALTALAAQQFLATGAPVTSLSGTLYMDSISALLTGVTITVSFLVFFYSIGYIRGEVEHGEVDEKRLGTYYCLLSLFLATMLAATLASNLLVMWAAIEATTLASAFLISFYNKPEALEAAWKFFLINSVGITLALVGIILLAVGMTNATGGINLDIATLMGTVSSVDPFMLKLAFAFVFVGFGTKVGIVPLHTWLPDAHSQAPTPVSAVLSGVLLNIALYGILRVYQAISQVPDAASFAASLFLFFGIISVGFASMRLFYQKHVKRLLAYSSVENMGIIMVAFGIGGPIGLFAAFFHLISHSLAKPLAFITGGVITSAFKTKDMDKIAGAAEAVPLFGLLFLLVALGVAGSVPFGTFFSEIALFAAGLSTANYLAVVLLVVFLTIAFGTMLIRISEIVLGSKPEAMPVFRPDFTMGAAIVALFLLAVYAAFAAPAPMISLIAASSRALTGGV